MQMSDVETMSGWLEYVEWKAQRIARENKWCDSCDGFGDHGFEEETNLPYICYACGGSGFTQEINYDFAH